MKDKFAMVRWKKQLISIRESQSNFFLLGVFAPRIFRIRLRRVRFKETRGKSARAAIFRSGITGKRDFSMLHYMRGLQEHRDWLGRVGNVMENTFGFLASVNVTDEF